MTVVIGIPSRCRACLAVLQPFRLIRRASICASPVHAFRRRRCRWGNTVVCADRIIRRAFRGGSRPAHVSSMRRANGEAPIVRENIRRAAGRTNSVSGTIACFGRACSAIIVGRYVPNAGSCQERTVARRMVRQRCRRAGRGADINCRPRGQDPFQRA